MHEFDVFVVIESDINYCIISELFFKLWPAGPLCIFSKLEDNYNLYILGEEFKTGIARDKSRHLISHFREDILKDLPANRPFRCPKCTYVGRDLTDLTTHYGLNHKIVFIGKNTEAQ